MARWGMVIDLDRCNGCQACEIACRSENNIAIGGEQAAREDLTISWMRVHTDVEGEWPDLRARFVPQPCMQCDRPPCTLVCPVQATSLDHEGIVNQIYARCIGCRYCANACPYTVKYFNWRRPSYPESVLPGLNPDVSVRPVGVVEKCTLPPPAPESPRCGAHREATVEGAGPRGVPLSDSVTSCNTAILIVCEFRTACPSWPNS